MAQDYIHCIWKMFEALNAIASTLPEHRQAFLRSVSKLEPITIYQYNTIVDMFNLYCIPKKWEKVK